MKINFDNFKKEVGKIFSDTLTNVLTNILTFILLPIVVIVVSIGFVSISYGLQKRIDAPLYLLLILIFFSLFGLIAIINSILEKIDFKSKNKVLKKQITIVDESDDTRIWKVDCQKINEKWIVTNKDIYCSLHNLKLGIYIEFLQTKKYFGNWLISICPDCEPKNEMTVHCESDLYDRYTEVINNKALREAEKIKS